MNQPQAQNYADALYAERQARETAEYDALVNGLAAAQSDAEVAQRDFTDAHYRGDAAGMADAQRRMARAESRITTLEAGKTAIDERETPRSGSYPTQSAASVQPRQYPPPMQIINSMTSLTPSERQWLVDHQDLLTRSDMITRLQACFYESVDRKVERDSPEYFKLFDERLGVYSAARNGLSKDEEDIANKSGISKEVYAENKRKLEALKAKGYYSQG